MTFEDAVIFFFNYGGVGRNVQEVMGAKPSEAQLDAAVDYAIVVNRRAKATADVAAQAIRDHWASLTDSMAIQATITNPDTK